MIENFRPFIFTLWKTRFYLNQTADQENMLFEKLPFPFNLGLYLPTLLRIKVGEFTARGDTTSGRLYNHSAVTKYWWLFIIKMKNNCIVLAEGEKLIFFL